MSLVSQVRGWARGHTGRDHYSPVGMTFHWVMAALVMFQLWWGWRIGRLPVGADKLEGYQLHSQVGLVILVLILLRGLWRLVIPGPVNDADKPGWQSRAAHLTHYAFYAVLIVLPLSGWTMWSSMAAEQPLSLAGAAPWPQLPFDTLPRQTRYQLMSVAERAHLFAVITLLVMIPLHVGAALKHQFWNRDDSLAGMVPFLNPLPPRSAKPHGAPPPRSDRRQARQSPGA